MSFEAQLRAALVERRARLMPPPPRKPIRIPPPPPKYLTDETRRQREYRIKRQRELNPSHVEPEDLRAPFGDVLSFLEQPVWRFIVHLVAKKHFLTFDDLIGPLRSVRIQRARQEAVYLVYTHDPRASLKWVGNRFGERHHTTILHMIRREESRRSQAPCEVSPAFPKKAA